jgi:hypothetical protein
LLADAVVADGLGRAAAWRAGRWRWRWRAGLGADVAGLDQGRAAALALLGGGLPGPGTLLLLFLVSTDLLVAVGTALSLGTRRLLLAFGGFPLLGEEGGEGRRQGRRGERQAQHRHGGQQPHQAAARAGDGKGSDKSVKAIRVHDGSDTLVARRRLEGRRLPDELVRTVVGPS